MLLIVYIKAPEEFLNDIFPVSAVVFLWTAAGEGQLGQMAHACKALARQLRTPAAAPIEAPASRVKRLRMACMLVLLTTSPASWQ